MNSIQTKQISYSRIFHFLILVFIFSVSYLWAADPLIEAKNYSDKGEYEEALKILRSVKRTYPDSDWEKKAYLMTAKIYEKQNNYDDAIKENIKIIEKYPKGIDSENAHFSVARLYVLQNKKNQAVNAYKNYINNFPDGEFRAIALFNMANIYKETGSKTNALKIYNEILRSYPDDMWIHSWSAIYSGHIYRQSGKIKAALESYDKVLRRKNNQFLYTLADLHRGQTLLDEKDYKMSQSIFQNILKNSKYFSEEALIGLGKSHYAAGEYDMAYEVFLSLVEMFPDSAWKDFAENKMKEIKKKQDKK